MSSTVTPCAGQLVAQAIGGGEIPGRAGGRALGQQSSDRRRRGRRSVGEDRQDPIQIAQRFERASGIVGRQRSTLDPTVQVTDQVEDGGQAGRHVEVVVERRAEGIAGRGERLGQRRIVGTRLRVRTERRDGRVQPLEAAARGARASRPNG